MERAKVTRRHSDFLGDLMVGANLRRFDYLIELNTTNNCVFIRGNHDELLLHLLRDSKRQSYVVQARRKNCTCL
jgi:serine/threonine protein phosphatase 1